MSKELKSAKFATTHGASDMLVIDSKSGAIGVTAEGIEKLLEAEGVTLDMVKKVDKAENTIHPALVYTAGVAAGGLFKENAELEQVMLQYEIGTRKHTTTYNRTGDNQILSIVESTVSSVDSELRKVHKQLRSMFAEINQ